MSWQYGWAVHYRKELKFKERDFGFDEDAARAFFEKIKKYQGDAALFRYRPQTKVDSFLETKIRWRQIEIQVSQGLFVLFMCLALMVLWRVTT